ncbi:MAG: protein kinase [Hamadaea sp.]|nr:protein kinase [Hamadaea sp.]NUT17773.1 protein kinase [Hamadaea sp.]
MAERERRPADQPPAEAELSADADADSDSPPVVGRPAEIGEVLAERYRLEEHINDDAAGRQVWRGVDIMLLRPIAVVLRSPGGDAAQEMLAAAVTASRVVHPNLIGVYDAIDEVDRAYVVREWIEGSSLRQLVEGDGALDSDRAISMCHAVADAVSALHASGMAHGNVHPGTVLLADDGRVVLTDARAGAATNDGDVRAIGGLLYYALTEQWPQKEAGPTALPDAVRDEYGVLAAPRQVRAGIATHVDDLVYDLLDPKVTLPSSDVLAAELGRLDVGPEERAYGTLRFSDSLPEPPRQAPRKLLYGVAAAVVLAVVGLTISAKALTSKDEPNGGGPTASNRPSSAATPVVDPVVFTLSGSQVALFDPYGGKDETDGLANAVDGKNSTGWKTDHYNQNFGPGGIKPGMGLVIDLGEAKAVADVTVVLSDNGASVKVLGGTTPPNQGSLTSFAQIGGALEEFNGTNMIFSTEDAAQVRYLVLWISGIPRDSEDGANRYQIGIQEITVRVK